MKKVRRFLIPVGFILIIIFVVVWYLTQLGEQSEDGPLQASGTVETVEVVVSPESAGKVADVRVREGDGVRFGDVLVTFEDVLLINQFDQAKAAQEQVQANYDLIAAQPLNEQNQVADYSGTTRTPQRPTGFTKPDRQR